MEWIFPNNLDKFQLIDAFKDLDRINWHQSVDINIGDIVYFYVAEPVAAIKFKCRVTQVDITSPSIDDTKYQKDPTGYLKYKKFIELKLEEKFSNSDFIYSDLKRKGLSKVQGPTRVSEQLSIFLNKAPSSFVTGLNIGSKISNKELGKLFKCGNMGGMRRSKDTGTLVIITDPNGHSYKDNWKDDVLYYTGMGKIGDQTLTSQTQNFTSLILMG